MKFLIVLSAVVAVALAKPSFLVGHHVANVASPLAYTAHHVYAAPHAYAHAPAPVGHDGRVVDTPEVAHAKAEHEAAHINEKVALANEAVKSADHVTYAVAPAPVVTSYHATLPLAPATAYHGAHGYHAVAPLAYVSHVPAAPIGHDGRVVDTPEVAHAKAEHEAAHVNEKITLAHEHAKTAHYGAPLVHSAYAPHYYSAHHAVAPISLW